MFTDKELTHIKLRAMVSWTMDMIDEQLLTGKSEPEIYQALSDARDAIFVAIEKVEKVLSKEGGS